MEDDVGKIDQLRGQVVVGNRVDVIVEVRVAFDVLDVLDRPGGQVVNYIDFVSTVKVHLGEVRPDKSGSSGDQNSHNAFPLILFLLLELFLSAFESGGLRCVDFSWNTL